MEPQEPPSSSEYDLNVSKIAQVNPGQTFNYNITITNNNKDLTNDAPLVLVTDKLPYEVEYVNAGLKVHNSWQSKSAHGYKYLLNLTVVSLFQQMCGRIPCFLRSLSL
jgi:uncharacterized repeat protein (TIGR01451 family)